MGSHQSAEVISQFQRWLDRLTRPIEFASRDAFAHLPTVKNLNSFANVNSATKDQLIQGLTTSVNNYQNGAAFDNEFAKAKAWGVHLLGYELGIDTFGPLNIAAKRAAMLDPRVKDLLQRYLTAWYAKGGEQLNWVTLGARSYNSEFGTWSITENADVLNSPKQQGFKAVRDARPPNGSAGTYVYA